jgi:apolipoprotein N-acyltransferase
VRAANTGISGFIAPSGKIISLLVNEKGKNIFVSGYDTQDITVSDRNQSFYARYGDIFIFCCFVFVILGTFLL